MFWKHLPCTYRGCPSGFLSTPSDLHCIMTKTTLRRSLSITWGSQSRNLRQRSWRALLTDISTLAQPDFLCNTRPPEQGRTVCSGLNHPISAISQESAPTHGLAYGLSMLTFSQLRLLLPGYVKLTEISQPTWWPAASSGEGRQI